MKSSIKYKYIPSLFAGLTLIYLVNIIITIQPIAYLGYTLAPRHGFDNILHGLTLFVVFGLPFKRVRLAFWYVIEFKALRTRIKESNAEITEQKHNDDIKRKKMLTQKRQSDFRNQVKLETDRANKKQIYRRDVEGAKQYTLQVPRF